MFQAPPLEILKTKAAQSLVAGGGPQVSVQGSSGLIPGPSDEPVHNSLEGESYSSTTSSPPSLHYSVTPSSLSYESTPSVSAQQVLGRVEVSTVSPSTYASQSSGGISTTERYSESAGQAEGSYRGHFESQKQSSIGSQYSGYSSTENYPVSGAGFEESAERDYQSQNQGLYYATGSGSSGYSSTPSPTLSSLRENSYSYVSGPALSSQEAYSHGESSTVSSEHADHQVTSYLADTNAAVDVTGNGFSQGLPGVRDYSANTRISAVLVAEGENHYEDNEIRQDYVSSTTPDPPKSGFKPIVVTDSNENPSTLGIFGSHGGSSTERYRINKLGKLYHREGRVKSNGGYSTSQPDINLSSVSSKGYEYSSTPAPTPEPVLVTPRGHPALLTSSGNILAPIRAGVSISNQHNEEDCDDKPVVEENKEVESSKPVIEKQEFEEEHYKTTVDIQKSIPFEIHPNEELSQEQYNYETKEQSSQEGYGEGIKQEYHQGTASGSQEHKQLSNDEYVESQSVGNVGGYSQNGHSEYQSQENNGATVYQQHQQHQTQEPLERQPDAYSVNQYNQNFLQQVVYAYHRLANNQGNQEAPINPGYTVNAPVFNQPLLVPNKLYYVYLQRYNPYVNRYGSQSQAFTNYNPQVTSTPVAQHTPESYGYNSQVNLGHSFVGNGQVYAQDYKEGERHQSNEQSGYATYVNHDASSVVSAPNSYAQHTNVNPVDETRYIPHSANGYDPHSTVTASNEQVSNVGADHGQAVSSTPYTTAGGYDSSNEAAQAYAAQLNALSNSVRGSVVHPDNQHVQYTTTGQGAESSALTQENYSQEQHASHEEINERHHQEKLFEEASNEVQHNANILIKEVPVPQYIEKTKFVEVEKPVHIPQPYPVEYTKVVEKPVPVPHPVPVTQTQIVEKHVPVPHPVPVEVTRVVEKHVPVPHPVPVEYTKVVAVEKPVAVPHPVPYAVTKLVAVDRPVAYPHPVPVSYAVPHPVGVPVPHLVPYPQVVPVPVKDYRPVYLYRKSTGGRLLHREVPHGKHGKSSGEFRPSQPVFTSQYPPPSYQVTRYFKSPNGKSRGQARKLCIEYGGFKPPLIPSVQVDEDPKPTYGPPAEQKH